MHRSALPIALILFAGCGPTAEQQAVDVFAEAQLFHDEGDLDKAQAGYGLAIELDPHNAVVYVHRAEVRLVTGDPDGALADCEDLIPTWPTPTKAGLPSTSFTPLSSRLLLTLTRLSAVGSGGKAMHHRAAIIMGAGISLKTTPMTGVTRILSAIEQGDPHGTIQSCSSQSGHIEGKNSILVDNQYG